MPNENEVPADINRAIEGCRVGNPLRAGVLDGNEPYRSFGFGDQGLLFQGRESNVRLDQAIDSFWNSDSSIKATVSRKFAQNALIGAITPCCIAGSQMTLVQLRQAITQLVNTPLQEYTVYRIVNGVELGTPGGSILLGPFTVFDPRNNLQALAGAAPEGLCGMVRAQAPDSYLVAVHVRAREPVQAGVLADARFRQFEHVVRFMIGVRGGRNDVGVSDFLAPAQRRTFFVCGGAIGGGVELTGATELVPLDDAYFMDPGNGNAWIWNTLGCANPTDMQRRILAAVEWVGKGFRDLDAGRALVQFVFALEAVLTFQQRNVMVTPSIASQILEFVAFILGRDYDSRLEAERLVKDIYSKRSAVAHGGAAAISEADARQALGLMKALIHTLIVDRELVAIATMEQLREWVNGQSSPAAAKWRLKGQSRRDHPHRDRHLRMPTRKGGLGGVNGKVMRRGFGGV